jgi:predicted  nucleic acid-binding Zn-ribbon protein
VSNPNDAFQKLEEKLLRVAEVLKRAHEEKRALQQELDQWKSGSKEDSKRVSTLEKELESLRKERDEVRARVEKIIQQIDVLTSPEAGG